jgi:hypothetical protein
VTQSIRSEMLCLAEAALYLAICAREPWAIRYVLSKYDDLPVGSAPRRSQRSRDATASEKSGAASTSQALEVLIEDDEYVEYCRTRHRVVLQTQVRPAPGPSAP